MNRTTIEPLFFGPPDARLFGMLTHPPQDTKIDRAVLICAPLGQENILYHRQLGLLARRLAATGRTTFRFDWLGVGDSTGTESLTGYLESIHTAVEALRRHAQVEDVDVVGLGIGATLALTAAARSPLTENIVLWSPPTTGRAYLRELRALDRIAVKQSDPPDEFAAIEGAELLGFVFSPSTLDGLGALDLTSLDPGETLPRRILLVGGNVEPDERLAATLRGRGAHVDTTVLPDLREVAMGLASETPVPVETLAFIRDWLPKGNPKPWTSSRPPGHPSVIIDVDGTPVRERGVVLHQEDPVFGIVATPDDDALADTWIVFATNRYARRIGPNRLYTKWARAWAARGVSSFRLDLSGTGDAGGSEAETDEDMYSEPVLDDARKALAFLREEYGARRFLFVGLCSGGTTGFRTAVVEPEVASVVLLNPQMLRWAPKESDVTEGDWMISRVTKFSSWQRLFQDRGTLFRESAPRAAAALIASTRWRTERISRRLRHSADPVETRIRASLDTLVERHCRLLFVFAGGDAGLGYLERYLGPNVLERFTGLGIGVKVIEGATHTFHAAWTQDAVRVIIEHELAASGFPLREVAASEAGAPADPADL